MAYLHFHAGMEVDEEAWHELVGLIGWMWTFMIVGLDRIGWWGLSIWIGLDVNVISIGC